MLKLDLASGQHPREGFKTVDLLWQGADICWDLVSGAKWPWKDDSVDELHCSHFIEHIPADEVNKKDRLFFFFDEAHRIIKPGGIFTVVWPALKSSNAFRDPTHRRFLPLEFTHYLSKVGRENMGVSHYNVLCDWNVEHTRLFTTSPQSSPWTAIEIGTLWEVQDSYEVVMRAVK